MEEKSGVVNKPWASRAKILTQMVMISGALNIGLISSLIYLVLQQKQAVRSFEAPEKRLEKTKASNEETLRSYSLACFEDLVLRLENKDLLEEGYTRRDLALASLVAFHHFPIDKILGGQFLQKRWISFQNKDQKVELTLFPSLSNDQFDALIQFARKEKWPLSTEGLFYQLSKSSEPSLVEAFCVTPEFHAILSLIQKTVPNISPKLLTYLLQEGSYERFKALSDKLRILQCYDQDTARNVLVSYLFEHQSKIAAYLLLQTDLEWIKKKFQDAEILFFFDIYPSKAELEPFAKELLRSPRSDQVWEKAASLLYTLTGEQLPTPYDHKQTLQKFFPQEAPPSIKKETQKPRTHKVAAGDSLWKIAKKYGVTVEKLIKLNNLETDKLRLGKELQIPDQGRSIPP